MPNHYFEAPTLDPMLGSDGLVTPAWIEYFTNQPLWDDLRFPAQGINPAGGGANAPTLVTADPWAGTLLFSASATNIVVGLAQLPHSWLIGSALHPHIHWSPTSTNTGNVAWRLSYQIAPIGATWPASLTTAGIELDAADGTTNKHQFHPFSTIDMSSYKLDGGVSIMLIWKLERVGGDPSDTYTGTARFLEFDIHYQSDGNGSIAPGKK